MTESSHPPPTQVIQPTQGWRFLDLRELYYYRELIYFLTWRDIKVRYKQTAVGIAWAVLQPLALMLVFTLFFGKLARIDQRVPTLGPYPFPYPLFTYSALLPWQLFARTLSETTNSLVTDQRLITKVYFPRIIVPTSYCIAATLDFCIGALFLGGLMLYYGIPPAATIVFLPVFMLLMFITALGVGFWLSALNTEYRDVMYCIPFLTQFWLFVTPVLYPSAMVPEQYRWLLGLNPMTGVVEGMRWSLFNYGQDIGFTVQLSSAMAVIIFVTGVVWFRYRERSFVDVLGGQ